VEYFSGFKSTANRRSFSGLNYNGFPSNPNENLPGLPKSWKVTDWEYHYHLGFWKGKNPNGGNAKKGMEFLKITPGIK